MFLCEQYYVRLFHFGWPATEPFNAFSIRAVHSLANNPAPLF
jgi:hypothetical protein